MGERLLETRRCYVSDDYYTYSSRLLSLDGGIAPAFNPGREARLQEFGTSLVLSSAYYSDATGSGVVNLHVVKPVGEVEACGAAGGLPSVGERILLTVHDHQLSAYRARGTPAP